MKIKYLHYFSRSDTSAATANDTSQQQPPRWIFTAVILMAYQREVTPNVTDASNVVIGLATQSSLYSTLNTEQPTNWLDLLI